MNCHLIITSTFVQLEDKLSIKITKYFLTSLSSTSQITDIYIVRQIKIMEDGFSIQYNAASPMRNV